MTSSSSNGNSCKSAAYVRPTFADDEVLTLHGCRQLSIPLPDQCANKGFVDVLEHGSSGWRFISHHNKILSSLSLDRTAADIKESILLLKAADGSACVAPEVEASLSHSLHLPPMLFGLDIMRIQQGTATLQLSAVDALVCWAFQGIDEELSDQKLEVIQVPQAKYWLKTQALAVEGIRESRKGDWTYCSDYCCSLLSSYHDLPDGTSHSGASPNQTPKEEAATLLEVLHPRLTGTIVRAASLKHNKVHVLDSFAPRQQLELLHLSQTTDDDWSNDRLIEPPLGSGAWTIMDQSCSGVDYCLLRSRDQPILFYDEFVLYQDDLEDCGEVIFEAKIRVMPSCWFVLSKLYLRVDGVLIRCRETRLYHNFTDDLVVTSMNGVPSPRIHMEVCWRELKAIGQDPQPAAAGSHLHPTAVGGVPPSIAAGSVWGLSGKTLTHLLPTVDDGDRFFTLTYLCSGGAQTI